MEHNYGARCIQALGFPRPPPGAATLRTVLRLVDREEGAAQMGAWAERLCSGILAPQDTAAGIAIDGHPSQR